MWARPEGTRVRKAEGEREVERTRHKDRERDRERERERERSSRLRWALFGNEKESNKLDLFMDN